MADVPDAFQYVLRRYVLKRLAEINFLIHNLFYQIAKCSCKYFLEIIHRRLEQSDEKRPTILRDISIGLLDVVDVK